MTPELISINDAVSKNITRLRRYNWVIAEDHIQIRISDQKAISPWFKFYSPANKSMNGEDPVVMMLFGEDLNEKVFLEYRGPAPGSDAYKAVERQFENLDT